MAESAKSLQNSVFSQQERKRAVFVFPIPEPMRDEVVKESIGLVKLKPAEELLASKRAMGQNYQLAWELAKASLVEVDGAKLNREDGQDERVWSEMDPQIRQLVLMAYNDLHNPEDDVIKNFLKGKTVTVK